MGSGRMSAVSDLCLAEEGLHPTFSSGVEESSETDDQADDSAVEHPTSHRLPRCHMYVYHNRMKASDIDGRYGANLGQRSSFHAEVG